MNSLAHLFPLLSNDSSFSSSTQISKTVDDTEPLVSLSTTQCRPGTMLDDNERCVVYNTSLERSSHEDNRELQVTPVTLYKTEIVSEYGSLISVNERYISYPIKNGLIRVINQTSVSRMLLRAHEYAHVTEIAFFNHTTDVMLSCSDNAKLVVWEIDDERDEAGSPSSSSIVAHVLQTVEIQVQRARWHPLDRQLIAIFNSSEVFILHLSCLSSPNSADVTAARLDCLGNTTQVQDMTFSPDGSHLVTSSLDGIFVFTTDDATCDASSFPGIAPICRSFSTIAAPCSLLFCGDDHNSLLIGTHDNACVSLWKNVVVSAQDDLIPQLVHELTMTQSTGEEVLMRSSDGAKKYAFTSDSTGCFIFLADLHDPVLYVLHLITRCGSSRFDNIRQFTLAQPIISMIVATTPRCRDRKSDTDIDETDAFEMQLFCIQTMAIQQYHVFTNQCYLPPVILSVDHLSLIENAAVDKMAPSSPPLSVFAPTVSNTRLDEGTLQEITVTDSAYDELVTPANTQHLRATSAPVGSQQHSDAQPSTRRSFTAASSLDDETLKVEPTPPVTLARDSQLSLEKSIHQIVRQEVQTVLIPAIGRIVLHTTEHHARRPLQNDLKEIVTPHLTQALTRELKVAVLESLPPLHASLNNVVDQVVAQVHVPVTDAFQQCFQDTIIPSFQAATQNMLCQINETMVRHTQECVASEVEVSGHLEKKVEHMSTRMEELVNQVASLTSMLQQAIGENTLARREEEEEEEDVNKSAVPFNALLLDQREEIDGYLESGDYESAFQQALSAQNVELVISTCHQVLPAIVLDEDAPTLSPMIILCLIQQLGSELTNSRNISFLLDWIRDGLLVLDPNDLAIAAMTHPVLVELQAHVGLLVSEKRNDRLAIVKHILKSMLSE